MSVAVPQTLQTRKDNFTEFLVARLENAYIENEDYLKILESRNVPNAFHYLDPPYINADNGHYSNAFSLKDEENLLNWLALECKGKFLLSEYHNPMLDEFVKVHGWYVKELTLKLSGAKSLNARKGRQDNGYTHRTEVLISNFQTPCGTGDLFKETRNSKPVNI